MKSLIHLGKVLVTTGASSSPLTFMLGLPSIISDNNRNLKLEVDFLRGGGKNIVNGETTKDWYQSLRVSDWCFNDLVKNNDAYKLVWIGGQGIGDKGSSSLERSLKVLKFGFYNREGNLNYGLKGGVDENIGLNAGVVVVKTERGVNLLGLVKKKEETQEISLDVKHQYLNIEKQEVESAFAKGKDLIVKRELKTIALKRSTWLESLSDGNLCNGGEWGPVWKNMGSVDNLQDYWIFDWLSFKAPVDFLGYESTHGSFYGGKILEVLVIEKLGKVIITSEGVGDGKGNKIKWNDQFFKVVIKKKLEK